MTKWLATYAAGIIPLLAAPSVTAPGADPPREIDTRIFADNDGLPSVSQGPGPGATPCFSSATCPPRRPTGQAIQVSKGILEWACQRKDAHYALYEYAHIGLGRRVAQFTEHERTQLGQMDWAKTILLRRNARPIERAPQDPTTPPEIA